MTSDYSTQCVNIQDYDWYQAFKVLAEKFQKHGHEIRVVGGAVRDIIRKGTPHDIDICGTACPDEMLEIFKTEDIIFRETGIQHGTVTVFKKRQVFELTSLREDRLDGDKKVCLFGKSFEEDAKRRDLTINTLSMDVNGKIFDYFGGSADLALGKLY